MGPHTPAPVKEGPSWAKNHTVAMSTLGVKGLSWMTRLFNTVWKSGTVPKEWQTKVVVLQFKNGDQRVLPTTDYITLWENLL